MPLVSIIMPSYNSMLYIEKAVCSVIRQSFCDWELIIIDDCSTDGTYGFLLKRFSSDPRIVIDRLQENSGGPTLPRNCAMQRASGEYIAFLDSDDEWHPNKLERQIYYMNKFGAFISCTAYGVVNEQGERVGSFTPPVENDYAGLLKANTIGCLTCIYNRKKIGELRFLECGHEDYALWLSILKRGYKVIGVQEELASYRLVRGSVSSNKLKVFSFFWNIYKNVEGFSFFVSLILCFRYMVLNFNKYKSDGS